MAHEFAEIVTGDGGDFFIPAGEEGDEDLQQPEVPVAAFKHAGVLLEEGLGVGGSPLQVSSLDLGLVHLPAAHLLVVLAEELVKDLEVFHKVRVGELSVLQQGDRLHQAAGHHFGEEDLSVVLGRICRRRVFLAGAGGKVSESGEGHANDLLARCQRDELDQGGNGDVVLGEVRADAVGLVQFVRQDPHAECELVQLLHGGLSELLVAGRSGRSLGAHAELAGHVLDAAGLAEGDAGFVGIHEDHEGRDAKSDQRSAGVLQLAHDPGGERVDGVDGGGPGHRSVGRCWCDVALGRACGDQDLGKGHGGDLLGVRIALSALVEHAKERLPLLHQHAFLADVEDGRDGDARGSSSQGGDDFVQLGESVVGDDAERVNFQRLHGLFAGALLITQLGHFASSCASRGRFGQKLQKNAGVHAGIA
mmetsp:Transcript_24719/g.69390  ORF Transcript_24719/g.69390 Transcript_24719/m.69390 type:complete len:420 (+) Transcript_24719:336-1595(+)